LTNFAYAAIVPNPTDGASAKLAFAEQQRCNHFIA
jgi:hypothetical protein